jgi:hypothetical protein
MKTDDAAIQEVGENTPLNASERGVARYDHLPKYNTAVDLAV